MQLAAQLPPNVHVAVVSAVEVDASDIPDDSDSDTGSSTAALFISLTAADGTALGCYICDIRY